MHCESAPMITSGVGRVRAALAEVVLDVPGRVEAELVGELDLLERLVVGLLLGLPLAVGVRLRHGQGFGTSTS